MESTGNSVQIAGSALGQNRHICAFFNGIDEQHRVLRSFIKDGLDRGDKAFHLVDPELREEHFGRLSDAGVNVDLAMGTGQLEVRSWNEGPLSGDRFDQDVWLESVEEGLPSRPPARDAHTQ